MNRHILVCPLCGEDLTEGTAGTNKALKCPAGHSFDIAKENYVNLLIRSSSSPTGDNREMARSRHAFLSKGYYKCLADALGEVFSNTAANTALDICCGEGYYTAELANKSQCAFYGFDLSKDMVRLAAKRGCGACFFVANLNAIPVKSCAFDFAFHLFAPFDKDEFYRVVADGGHLVTVIPGREHLLGLKEILYKDVYLNEEEPPNAGDFVLADKIRVKADITVEKEDILPLFQMTPYYFKSPKEGLERLNTLDKLSTPTEFIMLVYKK
ncbi:MAG: putative RNA methyltransferase [Eubacteriales bacterium]|jgi:23S rRNA (guanine745-N1)-methyltransferase